MGGKSGYNRNEVCDLLRGIPGERHDLNRVGDDYIRCQENNTLRQWMNEL